MSQQQGALSEVVAQQSGTGKSEPGKPDGVFPEMPEIGVQGFSSRNAEDDRSENNDAVDVVANKEIHRIDGIDGQENPGFVQDAIQTEAGDGHEPDHHDRAEQPAIFAVPLCCKKKRKRE